MHCRQWISIFEFYFLGDIWIIFFFSESFIWNLQFIFKPLDLASTCVLSFSVVMSSCALPGKPLFTFKIKVVSAVFNIIDHDICMVFNYVFCVNEIRPLNRVKVVLCLTSYLSNHFAVTFCLRVEISHWWVYRLTRAGIYCTLDNRQRAKSRTL